LKMKTLSPSVLLLHFDSLYNHITPSLFYDVVSKSNARRIYPIQYRAFVAPRLLICSSRAAGAPMLRRDRRADAERDGELAADGDVAAVAHGSYSVRGAERQGRRHRSHTLALLQQQRAAGMRHCLRAAKTQHEAVMVSVKRVTSAIMHSPAATRSALHLLRALRSQLPASRLVTGSAQHSRPSRSAYTAERCHQVPAALAKHAQTVHSQLQQSRGKASRPTALGASVANRQGRHS
jgi:hypothetical protein